MISIATSTICHRERRLRFANAKHNRSRRTPRNVPERRPRQGFPAITRSDFNREIGDFDL